MELKYLLLKLMVRLVGKHGADGDVAEQLVRSNRNTIGIILEPSIQFDSAPKKIRIPKVLCEMPVFVVLVLVNKYILSAS